MKIKNLSIICTVPDHPTQPRDHGPICILKHLWSLLLAFENIMGNAPFPYYVFKTIQNWHFCLRDDFLQTKYKGI